MTTYINQIVQSTRRLAAIDAEIDAATREERAEIEPRWKSESDGRQALVLTAMRDGVEPDLISWAIDAQTPRNRAATDLMGAALRLAAIDEQ